jgi:hypothetical protein
MSYVASSRRRAGPSEMCDVLTSGKNEDRLLLSCSYRSVAKYSCLSSTSVGPALRRDDARALGEMS